MTPRKTLPIPKPEENSLSLGAYIRMSNDQRVTSGQWSELDWAWEEIRQLTAVIQYYDSMAKR